MVHVIKCTQRIPVSVEKAWSFFSSPANLKEITPGNMGFDITSGLYEGKMYPGQIIEYRLRLLGGIKVYWMTEITHVEENRFFVDEQRFGPYTMWHHQHHFAPIEGGVEMTDIVHYKIPWGPLGSIAHAFYVKKQLDHIFSHRFQKIETIFGAFTYLHDA